MQAAEITIIIIDDNHSVLCALARVLISAGFHVNSFTSVDQFLACREWPDTACVIADISIPGMENTCLPMLLMEKGLHYPVIFLAAQDTEEYRAAASQSGGVALFSKPVDDQALINSINWNMHEARNETDLNQPHKIFN